MDFRNCPRECEPKHKWTVNIIDHHTKFVNVHTIHNKLADEGLNKVQKNCVTYVYPTPPLPPPPQKKKKLKDNGGEFENKKWMHIVALIRSNFSTEQLGLQRHKG